MQSADSGASEAVLHTHGDAVGFSRASLVIEVGIELRTLAQRILRPHAQLVVVGVGVAPVARAQRQPALNGRDRTEDQ